LKDAREAERDVSSDVLEEDSTWPKRLELFEDDGPQMTRVVFSQSTARCAERLAGISTRIPVDGRKLLKG